MRKPEYLSPTSMTKWARDPNEYYLKYLSDNPPPPDVQTQAMAVGSAFDAYVKSFLYERLFGPVDKPGNDVRFGRDAIFEDQVAPHNRDFGKVAGEHCLASYRYLGALDQLVLDLGRSQGPPQFEMKMYGNIVDATIGEVRYHVRPDLYFVNEHGARCILDWKVNGYCSMSGQSPKPGFVRGRRSGKLPWVHDDAKLATYKGIILSTKCLADTLDEEWARQLAVGAWVFGNPIGSDFIGIVHQLACRPNTLMLSKPVITVAEHVGFVSPEYQAKIHQEAVKMWAAITSDHVFRHLSYEDSKALCELLDQRKETLAGGFEVVNPALDD